MKNCPKCQANVSDTAKFCVKCGFNIKKHEEELANREYFCAECGTKFSGGTFCPECGYDVSADLSPDDNGDTAAISTIDVGFDFSAINEMAQDQLYEKEGFVVENRILTGYTGKKRIISIPGSIEEIYDGAFENNKLVSFVELQEGTKIIGKRAFANCSSLVKINIPASVKKIYDDTFEGVNLETLVLTKLDMNMIKPCLSSVAKKLFNMDDIDNYISKEDNKVSVDIKGIEETPAVKSIKTLYDGIAEGNPVFGSYYQSNDKTKEPIEWIVLEKDDKKALLISKYALDAKPFDDKGGYDWSSSSLRAWLNREFINSAFDTKEKMLLSSPGDKVFCLDAEEAGKYFSSDENRKCAVTAYAMNKHPSGNHPYCHWWTRTRTWNSYSKRYLVQVVASDGEYINRGNDDTKGSICGIRPAMWIRLDL